jgi:TolA-binding protein
MKEATKDSVTDSLYEEAYEAYEAGDYIDAIEGLTRVLRMDESYRSAIFYMGRAYHRLGDTVNAASYYQQLIDNYPNSGWAEEAQEYLDQIPAAGDDNKTE